MSRPEEILAKAIRRNLALKFASGKVSVESAGGGLDAAFREELKSGREALWEAFGKEDGADACRHAAPLSYSQERLWFLHQANPSSDAYLCPFAVRLKGRLVGSALEQAMRRMVCRHEILRTSFTEAGGVPIQRIHASAEVDFHVTDFSALDPRLIETAVKKMLIAAASTPLPLERAPAFRVRLARLSASEHVLSFCAHHIIFDAWSGMVFFGELDRLYREGLTGIPDTSRPPARPFRHFAQAQRQEYSEKQVAERTAEWAERFRALKNDALDLPYDFEAPPIFSGEGAFLSRELPRESLHALRELGASHQATLFMVLLAALAAYLHRITAQTRLVIGTPMTLRDAPDWQAGIGLFIDTLALPVEVRPRSTFAQFLDAIRELWFDALAHRIVPFEQLVEAVAPVRDFSANPLFQVMLVSQFIDRSLDWGLGGLKREWLPTTSSASKFDLVFEINESPNGLRIAIEYNRSRFRADTISRMLEQFSHLLSAVAGGAGDRLESLPCLPGPERHLLVREAAIAAAPAEACRSALGSFWRQADSFPDRAAIVHGELVLSYGRVARKVRTMSRRLKDSGVAAGGRVLVAMAPSADQLCVFLSVWNAGAVLVPVDPQVGAVDGVVRLASACRCAAVVCDEASSLAVDLRAEVIPVWDAAALGADGQDSPVAEEGRGGEPHPESAAYILFTSGTTDAPKGVQVSHGAFANYLSWAGRQYLGQEGGALYFSSCSFDLTLTSIFLPLGYGRAVIVVPSEWRRSLAVCRLIRRERLAFLKATPSHLESLLGGFSEKPDRDFRSMVVLGGEQLLATTVASIRAQWPGVSIVNEYGPTEATVGCIVQLLPPQGDVENPVPIGRPIDGTSARVLDRNFRPIGVGHRGELFLGGVSLADGYFNQPRITAETFLPDPFAAGARMYRTGDFARFRADGSLLFLGRGGGGIKHLGFRIALEEIEDAIAQHEAIAQVAVVQTAPNPASSRLVAFCVPRKVSSFAPSPGIKDWQSLYEHVYAGELSEEASASSRRWTGWTSAYDGRPIPEGEMEEWLRAIVVRIRPLVRDRVLEIGAGTGLLVAEIAPHVREYQARDFSENAVQALRRRARRFGWQNVVVRTAAAHEVSADDIRTADTVILNSVVQYFPCVEYLETVIGRVLENLRPGAALFLGDVRSLEWSPAFYLSRVRFDRPDSEAPEAIAAEMECLRLGEEELLVSAEYFFRLRERWPDLDVRVLVRDGAPDNELGRFRFDVVIRRDEALEECGREFDWAAHDRPLAKLEALLASAEGKSFAVHSLPHAALEFSLSRLAREEPLGAPVSLAAIRATARRSGWDVEFRLPRGARPGLIQAVLCRGGDAARVAVWDRRPDPGAALSNQPELTRRSQALGEDLAAWIARKLPVYKLPGRYQIVERLPRGESGKLDRARLSALAAALYRRQSGTVALPSNDREALIERIWCEVLGIERAGIDASFFDLGGNSLLMLKVIARLARERFLVEPNDWFLNPTIRQLARALDQKSGPQAMEREAQTLPLTPLQRRFFENHPVDFHYYNVVEWMQIPAAARAQVCTTAIRAVVTAHPALRSRFRLEGEKSVIIDPEIPSELLRVVDLSALDSPDRSRVHESAVVAVQTSLHVGRGPLFRLAAVWLGEQSGCFLEIALHHLVADGISVHLLKEDIQTASELAARGRPVHLLTTCSYADWANQSGAVRGEREKEVSWWLSHSWAEAKKLPLDHGTDLSANTRDSARRQALHFDRNEADLLLRRLPQRHGFSPESIFLAAIRYALDPAAEIEVLPIEFIRHGRDHPSLNLSRLVGWLVTHVPVPLRPGPAGSFLDAVRAVESQLAAVPARGENFQALRYGETPGPLDALPIPAVAFNYFREAPRTEGGDVASRSFRVRTTSGQKLRTNVFAFSAIATGETLSFILEYGSQLHKEKTIREIMERVGIFLRSIKE